VASLLILLSDMLWAVFDMKPMVGMSLFVIVPVFYLGVRSSKPWKVIVAGSVVLGVLLGGFFDFVMTYNKAWSVDRLIVPWNIFGIMPVDDAIGFFLMTLLVLVFYEHFISGKPQRSFGSFAKRFYKRAAVIIAADVLLALVFLLDPGLLALPYPYVVGGGAAVLVTIVGTLRHSELLDGLTKTALFFFFVWLLAELVAVYTGGLSYPGTQYMGWISLVLIRFPFEELFFWMLWYAPFVVVAYEFLFRRHPTFNK